MADRLAHVTAGDVQRILQTYFLPERRTAIRVEPEAPQSLDASP